MIRKCFLLFSVIIITLSAYAAVDLDSLEAVWTDVDRDSEDRLKAGQFLILYKYSKSNIELCKTTAYQMLELAEESSNGHYMAEALRTLGIVEHFSRNYTSSLKYYQQALKISQFLTLLNWRPSTYLLKLKLPNRMIRARIV